MIFLLALLAGCASDDARLQGTWHFNREATTTAALARVPSWTNLPPGRIEWLKQDLFGHTSVTYSNGMKTWQYEGDPEVFRCRYRVVSQGKDYVVVHSYEPLCMGIDIKIRFVDGGQGYWIDNGPFGFGLQERFNKVPSP